MILYLQIPQDLQAYFSSARNARHLGTWTGVFAASVRCSGLEPSLWVRVVSLESLVCSRQNPSFPARRIAWPRQGTRRPEGARRSAENCSVLCAFVLVRPLCVLGVSPSLFHAARPGPVGHNSCYRKAARETARLARFLAVLRIFFILEKRAFEGIGPVGL